MCDVQRSCGCGSVHWHLWAPSPSPHQARRTWATAYSGGSSPSTAFAEIDCEVDFDGSAKKFEIILEEWDLVLKEWDLVLKELEDEMRLGDFNPFEPTRRFTVA